VVYSKQLKEVADSFLSTAPLVVYCVVNSCFNRSIRQQEGVIASFVIIIITNYLPSCDNLLGIYVESNRKLFRKHEIQIVSMKQF